MSTLKTFAENSIAAAEIFLKQFAAWVTGLRNRYRHDVFFRTECNVIALQAAFALSLLFFIAIGFNYLYHDVAQTLVIGIQEKVAEGAAMSITDGSASGIVESIQNVKSKNFWLIVGVILVVTALFGYLIARITLGPARTALSSQKRFISDVAHELRTPLAVIKTNSEVALLDDSLDSRIKKTLRSNIEELDRTSEIINNLLSFSNWATPDRVKMGEVDLGVVIDAAIRKMKEFAQAKELKLHVRKKTPSAVWGNSAALEQIIVNLLKNAINYTPAGGEVFIACEPDYKGNILLTVQDTGIGIARKDLVHIFEPFFRAERSRNRQSGSSGLGLTIVSELVKLHRGRITIKSAPNRGTTAVVYFPYGKASGVPSGSAAREPEEGLGEISVDFLSKRL